ncbi:hypothetical protein ACP70R_032777 [Stipagrostis hirtigluma subsp. patula]
MEIYRAISSSRSCIMSKTASVNLRFLVELSEIYQCGKWLLGIKSEGVSSNYNFVKSKEFIKKVQY